MNTFRSYLAELFEKPWILHDTNETRGDDGLGVRYIYADPKAPEDYTKYLMVIFQEFGYDGEWELLFHRGGNFSAKGQGDAGAIFASVLDATKKFLHKHKPEFITFRASKGKSGSREKAYAALVKRFASQYGYRVDQSDSDQIESHWKMKRVSV